MRKFLKRFRGFVIFLFSALWSVNSVNEGELKRTVIIFGLIQLKMVPCQNNVNFFFMAINLASINVKNCNKESISSCIVSILLIWNYAIFRQHMFEISLHSAHIICGLSIHGFDHSRYRNKWKTANNKGNNTVNLGLNCWFSYLQGHYFWGT